MKEKQLRIISLSATGLILLLTLLQDAFADVFIFEAFNRVFSPLAMIVAIVGAYFLFKDTVTISKKSIWAVIVLAFALALKHFSILSNLLFMEETPALQVISQLLYTAGYAGVVASLLYDIPKIKLPIGFLVLAAAALFGWDTAVASLAEALLYIAMGAIAYKPTAARFNLIRIAAVVLAFLTLSATGLLTAVCLCMLAFILIPARKVTVNFRKLTAIVCVVTALVSVGAFFSGKPMSQVNYWKEDITDIMETITGFEEHIVEVQADLDEYTGTLELLRTDLENEQAALKDADLTCASAMEAWEAAKINLSAVCHRSSYSTRYCSSRCKDLHTAVGDSEYILQEAWDYFYQKSGTVEELDYDVKKCESKTEAAKADLKATEERIVALEEDLSIAKAKRSVEWFTLLVSFIALVLSVAALAYLGICLFADKEAKQALLACAAMALGALLYIVVGSVNNLRWSVSPLLYIITCPYTWSLAVTAFLAALFAKFGQKPVLFRVITIVTALLVAALLIISKANIAAASLYAIAMICISLVLVPVIFTEYISISKHIFFTLISGGIWNLIWIYHVTANLNKVDSATNRKPVTELLLCMFLPFYYIYWLLKTGEYVELYGAEQGKQYKIDIVCMCFAFICPLISTVLIQNKINQIVGKTE